MAISMRSMLAAAGGALLLSACAAGPYGYDYGDGYGGGYTSGYGYGYDYDYGAPGYYDPGYGYDSPGYYAGPSIGLGFVFSDRERHHHRHWRDGHQWQGGDHEWHGRDHDGDRDRDHGLREHNR